MLHQVVQSCQGGRGGRAGVNGCSCCGGVCRRRKPGALPPPRLFALGRGAALGPRVKVAGEAVELARDAQVELEVGLGGQERGAELAEHGRGVAEGLAEVVLVLESIASFWRSEVRG